MKRIAIIGCGNMGGGHAMAIGDGTGYTDWQGAQIIDPEIEAVTTDISTKLQLAGICDPDTRRQDWAKQEGYHIYPTLDDVLSDSNVDIVLVATPNHLHADIAIKAMRAGKHVLCEKPVCPTSAELERVLQVSKETGMVFYPRQNRRWDPDFLAMKKIYDEKVLGKPMNIENRVGGGGANAPFGWRCEKRFGGGMMLDWGVHLIDRLLTMNTSRVYQVFCQVFNSGNTDVDEGFNLTIMFEDGFVAYIEAGIGHIDPVKPAWRFNCANGMAEADLMTAQGARILKNPPKDEKFVMDFNALPTRKKPIMLGEGPSWFPRKAQDIEEPIEKIIYDRNSLYRNLVNCIEGTEKQIVTGEEALRVLRLMEAALHSAEIKRAVDFE